MKAIEQITRKEALTLLESQWRNTIDSIKTTRYTSKIIKTKLITKLKKKNRNTTKTILYALQLNYTMCRRKRILRSPVARLWVRRQTRVGLDYLEREKRRGLPHWIRLFLL